MDTWSQNVLFNFDSGASQETYIPLQLLADFGYGQNGSESGSPSEYNYQNSRT